MFLDWLLIIIGRTPAAYPNTDDKLAVIAAFLTDLIVPYGQVVLFVLPFIVIWRKKNWRFTPKSTIIALIVGGLLAWGAWWLDWWILALGQAAAFRSIYGN